MRKIVIIMLLLAGSAVYAQPTSGDIIMLDAEPLEREPTVEQAQQSFESILVTAFKTGNATKIATYFGDNVDLSILGTANLYSKSQAQQILQHFFTTNKPQDFKIIHKGNAKSSQYFIGELTSVKGGKYRVTLNSKAEGSKKTITSLTIEENAD